MALPPYLEQNRERIINAPNQQIALWNRSYDQFKKLDGVKEIYERHPDRNMQRKDVITLFEEDPYIGFIASMMWGGINATRPGKKGGTDTNFRLLLEHPQEKKKEAINFASEKVKKGNFQELFKAFENGEHKLPGVGYAYFTKLFFFLGQRQCMNDVTLKPLVFDKWLSNAHCALLIQQLNSDSIDRLPYNGVCPKPGYTLKIPTGNGRITLYEKYVKDMNLWAQELGVAPAKLEEFLFGESLKKNRRPDNPRIELWKIIANHTWQKQNQCPSKSTI